MAIEIVDFPSENWHFQKRCNKLPEGITVHWASSLCGCLIPKVKVARVLVWPSLPLGGFSWLGFANISCSAKPKNIYIYIYIIIYIYIPSGNLLHSYGKCPIYRWFTYYKWWFSYLYIYMCVLVLPEGNISICLSSWSSYKYPSNISLQGGAP